MSQPGIPPREGMPVSGVEGNEPEEARSVPPAEVPTYEKPRPPVKPTPKEKATEKQEELQPVLTAPAHPRTEIQEQPSQVQPVSGEQIRRNVETAYDRPLPDSLTAAADMAEMVAKATEK